MKFSVEYNPEFYNDIVQAVDWYNEKQPGLGDRFLSIVKRQTSNLSTSALHFAIKYDDIRCMGIEKFPFLVHYRVLEHAEKVKIEALLHTSRDPKVWFERTGKEGKGP